jgi:type I restriction enzyme S subunit
LIGSVDSVIEKLKEYRTALITNAVTGKIDVRDIKLPDPTPAEAA